MHHRPLFCRRRRRRLINRRTLFCRRLMDRPFFCRRRRLMDRRTLFCRGRRRRLLDCRTLFCRGRRRRLMYCRSLFYCCRRFLQEAAPTTAEWPASARTTAYYSPGAKFWGAETTAKVVRNSLEQETVVALTTRIVQIFNVVLRISNVLIWCRFRLELYFKIKRRYQMTNLSVPYPTGPAEFLRFSNKRVRYRYGTNLTNNELERFKIYPKFANDTDFEKLGPAAKWSQSDRIAHNTELKTTIAFVPLLTFKDDHCFRPPPLTIFPCLVRITETGRDATGAVAVVGRPPPIKPWGTRSRRCTKNLNRELKITEKNVL